jgi:hypothetical protein
LESKGILARRVAIVNGVREDEGEIKGKGKRMKSVGSILNYERLRNRAPPFRREFSRNS